MSHPSESQSLQDLLKNLPDLERSLAQLNGIGCLKYHPNHPDLRAILQDEVSYNKKKIQTFLKTLNAMELIKDIPNIFSEVYSESKYI